MGDYDWQAQGATYLNPVYPRSCPDPFILKHLNDYWCYCTGFWHDGRCFGVLHSKDLVRWRELGGALAPLDDQATCYWAPEVVYEDGRFLMYYSVGNETTMQIRAAVADHPAGPFIDCGARLTSEEFAIDAHVFVDDDRDRYLFYAVDYLRHARVGTGTAVDRMLDPLRLAGRPRPVTRPGYEWQTYDPRRAEKGGVHWHTVEGPFVLKHKGRYYQMFSGGNWKNATYGVSYAVSDRVMSDDEWRQVADGELTLPIMRTIPDKVIGPGHNSVTRGPDNQQLYCVYHRWDAASDGRVLAIDPLEWVGERMLIVGPSHTPRPAPLAPAVADFPDRGAPGALGRAWACDGGRWYARQGKAVQESVNLPAEARCLVNATHFVAEVSLRALAFPTGQSTLGVRLHSEQGVALHFNWAPGSGQATLAEQRFDLPRPCRPDVFHLLRLEVNGPWARALFDGGAARWEGRLQAQPTGLSLFTHNAAAEFAGFALTVGWQDLFTEPTTDPADLGWQVVAGGADWRISDQHLCYVNSQGGRATIVKGSLLVDYEMVVNAKLVSEFVVDNGYGILPTVSEADEGPLLALARDEAGWWLTYDDGVAGQTFPLSPDFDPYAHQQFRLRKRGGRLIIQHECEVLGEVAAPAAPTRVGLYAHRAVVAFDMARVTAMLSHDLAPGYI